MATLAEATVEIRADLGPLRSALSRGEAATRGFASSSSSAADRVSASFGRLQAAFAAVGVIDIAGRVIEATSALAKLQDTANRTGLSTREVQEFGFAVQLSGGEAEQASGALEKFAVNSSKAAQGVGPLAKILQANNVALKDQSGHLRPVGEMLRDVADLVKGATSEQDRLNISTAAFGKSAGPALVGALSDGRQGIDDYAKQAQQAGAIIEDSVIKKAAELDDQFDTLKLSMNGIGNQLAVEFLGPQVQQAMQGLLNFMREVKYGLEQIKSGKFSDLIPDMRDNADGAMARAKRNLRIGIDTSFLTPDDLEKFYGRTGAGGGAKKGDGGKGDDDPTLLPPIGVGANSFKRTADDRFNDDLQSIRDRTAALRDEMSTVTLGYGAQEQRRTALQLEQDALKDLREEARRKGQTDLSNIALSDEQKAKIQEVAAAYGTQAYALRRVQEAQERAEQAAGEFYDAFKSSLTDVIKGTSSLKDALSSVADKLSDMFLNSAFDSLFQPSKGGSTGGSFGGIFDMIGGLFGGARAAGGPVEQGRAYLVGEKGPEIMMPGRSGTIVPNSIARPALAGAGQMGGGGPMSFNYAPVYNVTGTGAEIENLQRRIAKNEAEFQTKVEVSVRKGQNSRKIR
jgi:hypothetical protein